MQDRLKIMELNIKLESLLTIREGMYAENILREQRGEMIAYGFDEFSKLAKHIADLLEE